MKTCSACGAQNPEAARFCRSCGNAFATEAAPAAPAAETAPVAAPAPAPEPAPTQTFATVTPEPAAPVAPQPAPTVTAAAPTTPVAAPQPAAQTAPQQQTTGYVPQPVQPQPAPQPAYVAPQQPAAQPQNAYAQQPYVAQPQPGQPAQPAYAPQGYAAPGAPVAPAQPNPTDEAVKAFGGWLLGALKRPAAKFNTLPWWSFVVTVVTTLVTALLVYTWAAKVTSTATSYVNSLSAMFGGGSPSYSAPAPSAEVWFKGWIVFLILMYASVLMTFIGRKILGDPASFFEVHDMIAQRNIPFCILYIILILLSLVGGHVVALAVFEFTYLVTLVVLPGALIAKGENRRKGDSFWLWLGAIVVCFVILIVAIMLCGAIGGSVLSDALNINI